MCFWESWGLSSVSPKILGSCSHSCSLSTYLLLCSVANKARGLAGTQAGLILPRPSLGSLGVISLGKAGDAAAFSGEAFHFAQFLWEPWRFPWDREQQSRWQCQELTRLQEEAGQEEGGWQRCCWNYTTGGGSSITGKTKWGLSCSYSEIFLRN